MIDLATPPIIPGSGALGRKPPSLPDGVSQAEYDAIRKTATDFESMMLGELLSPMFEGLETEGPFGGGQAEKTWRGLMVREYGNEISRSGGIGIADQIVRQLLNSQEVPSP